MYIDKIQQLFLGFSHKCVSSKQVLCSFFQKEMC